MLLFLKNQSRSYCSLTWDCIQLKTLHAVNWRFTHSTVGAVVTLLAYEERSVADSISQVIVLAIIGRMSAAAVVLFYKSSMSFVSGRSKKGP